MVLVFTGFALLVWVGACFVSSSCFGIGYRRRFGVDLIVIRFIMISVMSCGFGVPRCFLLGYFASWFVFCGVGCVWCLGLLLVVCFLVVGCCIFVVLCCFVLGRLA